MWCFVNRSNIVGSSLSNHVQSWKIPLCPNDRLLHGVFDLVGVGDKVVAAGRLMLLFHLLLPLRAMVVEKKKEGEGVDDETIA